VAERWTVEDERNLAADRLMLRKLEARQETPPEWLVDEISELTRRKKAAKTRRPKGEGGIYQRADGLWCAAVQLPESADGKRRRKVVARKDKAEVIKELRRLKDELARHGNLATSSITVAAWMNRWLDEIAPVKIRPKTLAGYRTVVNGYILPVLGRKRLEKLTAQDVRALHTAIQTTPKDPALRGLKEVPEGTEMLSSTYALLAHNVLATALKVALREGLVTTNVCDLVDRPRKRKAEQGALELDEAIAFLKHLATHLDGQDEQAKMNAAMWATALLTGARRGEILGIEKDRVGEVLDLSWQLQRITDISKAPADWEHRHLRSTLYLTRPKSSAGWRIIPLVEPLRSILHAHIKGREDGLIFTRNDLPWDPDGATEEWSKALKAAGIAADDVSLHGARHGAVDILLEAGVHEAVVSEIVGHSNRATTRAYKSKGNTRQLTDAMNKMSKLLEQ